MEIIFLYVPFKINLEGWAMWFKTLEHLEHVNQSKGCKRFVSAQRENILYAFCEKTHIKGNIICKLYVL